MTTQTRSHHRTGENPLITRIVAATVVVVVLAAGLWFWGSITDSYALSIALSGLWFGTVGLGAWAVGRRRPSLRTPVMATFLAAAVAGGVGFYWTSIRDERVNEAVVTGVAPSQAPPASVGGGAPASVNVERASGAFVGKAHPGRGTAAVVELAQGGSVLTLTDFETDNGPDLRVYLARGGDGVDGAIDLGGLKGNVGNQQYEIPAGTDLDAYPRVVIWCRAFSVSFTEAELRAT